MANFGSGGRCSKGVFLSHLAGTGGRVSYSTISWVCFCLIATKSFVSLIALSLVNTDRCVKPQQACVFFTESHSRLTRARDRRPYLSTRCRLITWLFCPVGCYIVGYVDKIWTTNRITVNMHECVKEPHVAQGVVYGALGIYERGQRKTIVGHSHPSYLKPNTFCQSNCINLFHYSLRFVVFLFVLMFAWPSCVQF